MGYLRRICTQVEELGYFLHVFRLYPYRASALNLVVTAIIIWNTIYIEQAVNHLRQQGMEITDKHLHHLTPLGWEHIALTGDYVWDATLTTSLENLHDLRA